MRYVRRFNRADIFDIDGIQRWLEEMSRQGLHLVRWGETFSTFRRGEPENLRYRLEPERTGAWMAQLPDDVKAYYQDMGWDYVCSMGNIIFYILRCSDPDTPELYTDPDSLARAMKRVKKIATRIFYRDLFIVFLLGLAALSFWKNGVPTDIITDNFSLLATVFSLFYLPFLILEIYQGYRFQQAFRVLKQNRPLPESNHWHQRLAFVQSACIFAVLVIALMIWGYRHYESKNSSFESLDMISIDIPLLTEIEGRAEYVMESFQDEYSYDFHPGEGTYFVASQSILAPVQYYIVQNGQDNTVFWRELLPDYPWNMRYYSNMQIELWETCSPELAEKLLTEKLNIPSSEKEVLSLDIPGYEMVIMHLYPATASVECTTVYYLFLQKGDRAAYVYYYGAQDLRDHLDLFLQMMEADWENP